MKKETLILSVDKKLYVCENSTNIDVGDLIILKYLHNGKETLTLNKVVYTNKKANIFKYEKVSSDMTYSFGFNVYKTENDLSEYLGRKLNIELDTIFIKVIDKLPLDSECVNLVLKLNELDGIETFESCSGHLKEPYRIWFNVHNKKDLAILVRAIDKRYWKYGDRWEIKVITNDKSFDSEHPFCYYLESKNKNKHVLKEADALCSQIDYWIKKAQEDDTHSKTLRNTNI